MENTQVNGPEEDKDWAGRAEDGRIVTTTNRNRQINVKAELSCSANHSKGSGFSPLTFGFFVKGERAGGGREGGMEGGRNEREREAGGW